MLSLLVLILIYEYIFLLLLILMKLVIKSKLRELQVPIPTQPLYCSLEECLTSPPKCYTNNQPNYNPLSQLSEILVGGHMGWYQEPALVNDLHPELGLHDKKFYFKVALFSNFIIQRVCMIYLFVIHITYVIII